MRFKEICNITRENYKKIFDCSDHFKNKERDESLDNFNLELMLSAFGKDKLSVNRYNKNGDPMLLYLYRLNKNHMFKSFWCEYSLKLTDKTKVSFINRYMTEYYIENVIINYDTANYEAMVIEIKELLVIVSLFNEGMRKEENRITNEFISDLLLLKKVQTNKDDFHDFINMSYSMYEKSKILLLETSGDFEKKELKKRGFN